MRDPSKFFAEMTEFELCCELKSQGITGVKRFTFKKDDKILPTNTYLLTFAQSSPPKSIKAGYFNLQIQTYIPNPLRCFKCQKFGHGISACRGQITCAHCGEYHNTEDCKNTIKKCVNCSEAHSASSKQCAQWQLQVKVNQIKYTQNVTFQEAKKLATGLLPTGPSFAAVAGSKTNPSTRSVACQSDLTWVRSSNPQPFMSPKPVTTTTTQSTQASTQSTLSQQSKHTVSPATIRQSSKGHKSKKTNNTDKLPKNLKNQVDVANRFESLELMDDDSPPPSRSNSHSPSRRRSSSTDAGGRALQAT